MRILMIAHAFPPTFGGVESHLWDITTRLVQCGHAVLCLVGGEVHSQEEHHGVYVVRHPTLTVQNLLKHRIKQDPETINQALLSEISQIVSDVIAAYKPSHIHIHNAHHFAPELALSLFACRQYQLPLINSVHDRVGEHLFQQVLDYPWTMVLYASHYLRRSIPTQTASEVLWLGIDLARFTPSGAKDSRLTSLERPVIFHPARLLRWKGVDVGLQAFVELRRKTRKGTLILCSSERIVDDQADVIAFKDELAQMASVAGISRCVRYLSFDRLEIASAYRAADLVWYPTTDDEPFGLVPLEAMACAVPLVVSRSGGMMETVADRETGLVVNKNDSHALADAALSLLSDAPLRKQIVKQGQKQVRLFGIESYVSSLEKIYREVS